MSRNEPVDVCVIGSGASGSVVAATLAAAGRSVAVLESGRPTQPDRIPTARDDWERHLFDFFPRDDGSGRIAYAGDNEPGFHVSRFKGVGGSTMHFEGFYIRMHPGDLRRRTELGIGADWPVTYEALAPYYDRVEARLGVSGTLDNPFDPPRGPYPNPAIAMSCAVQRMKTGCDALGLHAAHAPVAIISRPDGDRGACNFCGGCWSGCLRGAISNAAQTYLADALGRGATLRTRASATRLVLDRGGRRVTGVEYLDENRELQLQSARQVVLCGNAIETPRLLLMSSRHDHPEGLANDNGLVGRYFSAHVTASVTTVFDERVDAHKGPNINGMVQDFWDHDDARGFAGGYVIALRNAELGPHYLYRRRFLGQPLFGAALLDALSDTFGHTATLSAYGEHFASADDRVDLHPDMKDTLGLPVPRVRIRHRDNEHAMHAHMSEQLRNIIDAAGGRDSSQATSSRALGTHLMGTCRMGDDPSRSVVDVAGRVHELDNLYIADGSLFPTSTPSNPTLTIQAMALRIAEGMAALPG